MSDAPDTASGGAPEPPDTSTPKDPPTPPGEVNPDDGTDAEGKPVDNPAG